MRLYERLVRRLYQVNLFQPVQLGLTSTQRLYQALGRPMDDVPIVHIAGTNGKGSVALKMARSLQLGELRTGLFVSPHVSCFRERIQVDGELIPEETVEDLLPKIFELCESKDIPATFFEITTVLALEHWKRSRVDVAVVETGLGGRLDATNILSPALSIITSIGLDHTRILGSTIEEIAMEKAGIIKPGVPVLVGERCPVDLLKEVAESRASPFYRCKHLLPEWDPSSLPDFDEENSRLAEAGLRLLWERNSKLQIGEEFLQKGIAQRPPCRFDVMTALIALPGSLADASPVVALRREGGAQSMETMPLVPSLRRGTENMKGVADVTVVLDVAHNEPAIKSLGDKLRKEFPGRRVRVVVALSGDKDKKNCLERILKFCGPDRIHFAEACTPRAAPPSQLASKLTQITGGTVDGTKWMRCGDTSVRRALRDALVEAAQSRDALGEKDIVVVFGTVFMMVDARSELGFNEPKDSPWVAEVRGSNSRMAQESMPLSGTHG